MNLTLKSASDPVWANAAMTAINVIVEFNEIVGAMPFTASESDTEPHGKTLFDLAAAGDFGVVGSFVAPEPLIPQIVTPRQARLALLSAGLLSSVDTAINAMEEPAKTVAQIEWQHATEIDRNSPLVAALALALELDAAALDALFIAAALFTTAAL